MAKRGDIKKHSKSKLVIFSIVVALMTVFFVIYAIQSIYPSPKYERYCSMSTPFDFNNKTSCEKEGGIWTLPEGQTSLILSCNKQNNSENYQCTPTTDYQKFVGYCNIGERQCEKDYRTAIQPYEFHVFILNLVIGLMILIGGFFLAVETVSVGFIASGAILMVYGTIRYWAELSDVIRTLLLGIALIILVYFGYKRLKD